MGSTALVLKMSQVKAGEVQSFPFSPLPLPCGNEKLHGLVFFFLLKSIFVISVCVLIMI